MFQSTTDLWNDNTGVSDPFEIVNKYGDRCGVVLVRKDSGGYVITDEYDDSYEFTQTIPSLQDALRLVAKLRVG